MGGLFDMSLLPGSWRPLAIDEIGGLCGEFTDWVLCGGHAVALLAGRDTRPHGDVDIGVFRSQVEACLRAIGRKRVWLCWQGEHVAWDGGPVPAEVHDIWIADEEGKFWILQLMIYDDEGDRVIFRRNRDLWWPKSCHAVRVGGLRILNPFVSFLFKASREGMEAKEIHDLRLLIESGAEVYGRGSETAAGGKQVARERVAPRFAFKREVDLSKLCLEGKRVRLRSIDERYASEVWCEFTAEVTRYMMPKPASCLEDSLDFIRKAREGMEGGWDLVCVILRKEDEEFLGCCGLHGRGRPRRPELGIWLKKSAHGHGFGREAIFTLVDWALAAVDFDLLVYPVDRANVPSRRIPEALGGQVAEEKVVKTLHGSTLDELVYHLPRDGLQRQLSDLGL